MGEHETMRANAHVLLLFAMVTISHALSFNATDADIYRAVTRRPRDHYRGQGSLADANRVLNGHLASKTLLKTRPCETFTVEDLKEVSGFLYGAADDTLLKVYADSQDNRRQIYSTAQQMLADFARLGQLSQGRNDLQQKLRDGFCHRVVMWFIHHLPEKTQIEMANLGIEIPFLPVADHSQAPVTEDSAAQAVQTAYQESISCQKCHVGGISNLGVPEVKPTTAKQLARRCYTNYKELFNITCGPCDGVAGAYWGDSSDKYFTPDLCSVVGTPESIPESERVQPVFPEQFSVDVVAGSDRWGRTTNPSGHVKTPFPPILDSMYGQITGKWFVDITPDSDVWLLRHDTKYRHVSFNGTFIPLLSFHVSEIHSQTSAQQASNNSGPMVSLIDGLPNFLPGGCTCVQDPVGVPDVHHVRTDGLDEDNMQYLGRINLTLSEWDGRTVTVDHWYNWFFHVYMAVDETVAGEHFGKAPERLSSAYAGTACYQNWNLTDPTLAIP